MIKRIGIICLLFSLNKVLAQEFFLKHYGIDDGLPSNEIYQVLQDENGNLLGATDRGAVRFDGYSFQHLPLNKQEASYPVFYIYKAPAGGIFFSGLKGYLYQYNDTGLVTYSHNDKIAALYKHAGLLIANTLSLHQDSLWISYNNDYNYNHNIGSGVVTPAGKVYKLVKKDGIYFDFQRQFFYRQVSAAEGKKVLQPVYITWKDGTTSTDTVRLSWLSGYVRRLYVEQVSGFTIFCIGKVVLVYQGKKKLYSHLFDANILSSTVINGTDLYLGFEYGGAAVYKIGDIALSPPLHHYLQDLTVNSILQDHQKGIWFSTQENGLYYAYPSLPQFWENETKIVSIQKSGGKVYVAQRSGLIQVYAGGKLSEQLPLPLKEDAVHNISFYNDSLLALTGKGLYLRSGSKWRLYPTIDIQLWAGYRDEVYGAASASAELYVFSKLGGKLLQRIALPKRVISMHYAQSKELWLGTWEGLFRYDKQTLTDLTKLNPVFSDRIVSIKEMHDKAIVIASLGNGLALYKNGKAHILNIRNGLLTPVINSMEVDGDFIWLGTNKGLTRVAFKDDQFEVKHYGLEAGLPTLDIHEFSVAGGQLYVKWINRLVTLSLHDLPGTDKPLPVHIKAVYINDQQINLERRANFRHNENQFKINFSSINLAAAREQQFLYMLEGFDKRWNMTSARVANYTNLPPGSYSFKVRAFIGKPETATDVAAYDFTIEPAYWQQWWFPVTIIFILLFFSWLIVRRRIASIQRKNNLLLDLAESQQKVLVQLINPHFIFNILNSVQAAILQKDKIVAASIISRFAKLMRLSMELSKEKLVSLEKELEFLHMYFEMEGIRSPGKFRYHTDVQSTINTGDILIPSMLIQPFVENAIKHGISHLCDKEGVIQIKFECDQNQVLCTIDDNGVGRVQSAVINGNRQTQHQSSGIEITLNRLNLLHKEQDTKLVYTIIDKVSNDGASAGTTVIFSLPFKMRY